MTTKVVLILNQILGNKAHINGEVLWAHLNQVIGVTCQQ